MKNEIASIIFDILLLLIGCIAIVYAFWTFKETKDIVQRLVIVYGLFAIFSKVGPSCIKELKDDIKKYRLKKQEN